MRSDELLEIQSRLKSLPFALEFRVRQDSQAELSDREKEILQGFTRAFRRDEFSSSRACAHAALRKLGCTQPEVLRGANGEPLWPQGFIGSITHSQDLCAAGAARQDQMLALGLDLEHRTPDGKTEENIVSRVCTPQEQEHLCEAPSIAIGSLVTFSAKEAFYKAQYPITGKRELWFRDVELQINWEQSTFRAYPVRPSPWLDPVTCLHGGFLQTENLLFSYFGLSDKRTK